MALLSAVQAVLLIVLLPTLVGAQDRLRTIDPLTEQAPGISIEQPAVEISGRVSSKSVANRIVPALAEKLKNVALTERLTVIVTLELASATDSAALAVRFPGEDGLRKALIAQQSHEFVALASSAGFDATRALSNFPILIGTVAAGDIEALSQLPWVLGIEEERVLEAFRTEGAALMRADQLRDSFGGHGSGVAVAVFDSGVDAGHPELFGKVTVQGNYTDDPGDGTNDGSGHGTSVSGIIAGDRGLAPQATIWAIKVLDSEGSGTSSGLLQGLNGVYDVRNDFGGVDILNLSLGFSDDHFTSNCDSMEPAFTTVFRRIKNSGIPIFVAAGNEGRAGVSFPACVSHTIAVGAVYDANIGRAGFDNCVDQGTYRDLVTCYSNSGPLVALLAPSHCSVTPKPGTGHESCFGGTSAASPYAAAVAAQLLSLNPSVTPDQLLGALKSTGKIVTDPANGQRTPRIDALAAFNQLGSGGTTQPCVSSSTVACLNSGRFELKTTFQSSNGATGSLKLITYTDATSLGYFNNSNNIEFLGKVLNACSINNKFWVFLGGVTDQGITVRVRDTRTGATRTYSNSLGNLYGTQSDTNAFNC